MVATSCLRRPFSTIYSLVSTACVGLRVWMAISLLRQVSLVMDSSALAGVGLQLWIGEVEIDKVGVLQVSALNIHPYAS